jgi:hypothetical protein
MAGSVGLEPSAHATGPGSINAGVFNLMRQISLLHGPKGGHGPYAQFWTGGYSALADRH